MGFLPPKLFQLFGSICCCCVGLEANVSSKRRMFQSTLVFLFITFSNLSTNFAKTRKIIIFLYQVKYFSSLTMLVFGSRGAVAQLLERPSKVPVWCNSLDVGSNHAQRHVISLITPRHKVVYCRYKSAVWELVVKNLVLETFSGKEAPGLKPMTNSFNT